MLEVDSFGSTVRRRSLPTLGSVLDGLVVDSDSGGTLYLGSFRSVAALNLDVGADTAAPWPLPHHDVSNSSSAVLPLSQAPDSIAASGTPWVGGNRGSGSPRERWCPTRSIARRMTTSPRPSESVVFRVSEPLRRYQCDAGTGVSLLGDRFHPVGSRSERTGVGRDRPRGPRTPQPAGTRRPPDPIPVVRPDQTVVAATQTGLIVAADLTVRPHQPRPLQNRIPDSEMMATADGRVLFRRTRGFSKSPGGIRTQTVWCSGQCVSWRADNHLRTREGTGFLLRDATGSVVGPRSPRRLRWTGRGSFRWRDVRRNPTGRIKIPRRRLESGLGVCGPS